MNKFINYKHQLRAVYTSDEAKEKMQIIIGQPLLGKMWIGMLGQISASTIIREARDAICAQARRDITSRRDGRG